MISVIIASDRSRSLSSIRENITATIGVDHEIIHIAEVANGLCSAYNAGASKASYATLCFVHDDVLFHSQDWGMKVLEHLKDRATGVIGVMGGKFKSANGLTWRDGEIGMHRYCVMDGVEHGKKLLSNPLQEQKSLVVCLDGAFLSCRKSLWECTRFDEKTFCGFHFYDADFCMQAAQQHKNYVVYDILIEHFSQGRIDKLFIEDSLLFESKWSPLLPASIAPLSGAETAKLEGYCLAEKVRQMRRTNFGQTSTWRTILKYFRKHKNVYHLIRSSYFGIVK